MDPGYRLYDADEHYYEPEDAVTRHLDRSHRHAVRWIEMDGRRTLLVNDQLLKLVPNPTYDPVGRPGALSEYFRAKNQEGRSLRDILGELQPIQPEYRDRGRACRACSTSRVSSSRGCSRASVSGSRRC